MEKGSEATLSIPDGGPMTYGTVVVPSTFSPTRRPIYLYPVAEMSRKKYDTAIGPISVAVNKILATRSGRILVHTVSYDLNKALNERLAAVRPVFTYGVSAGKQRAIDQYLADPDAVLLAPSLERGIDLPQEYCRHIVIPKIPFPSIGDKQVSQRMYTKGGRLWYAVKTIRSLVQMTGRGFRSEDDECSSYILDKNFLTQIWRQSKHLLPEWWKEALVWDAGQL
jgi:ATP-dependent DNA helicase DinG